tara:strand:- start:874 stop:1335 length:462 start_codon:yes stop_codon:yes gene_type:complete
MNYENPKHKKVLKSCLGTWFSNPKDLHLTDPRMSFPFKFNQWVKISYNNKDSETWGAFSKNWMVGMCSMKKLPIEKQVHLYHIYVDKEHRRLGIGKKLIKKIIEQAKKTEMKIILLNVVAGNKVAISLYSKMGFIQEKQGQNIRLVKIFNRKY